MNLTERYAATPFGRCGKTNAISSVCLLSFCIGIRIALNRSWRFTSKRCIFTWKPSFWLLWDETSWQGWWKVLQVDRNYFLNFEVPRYAKNTVYFINTYFAKVSNNLKHLPFSRIKLRWNNSTIIIQKFHHLHHSRLNCKLPMLMRMTLSLAIM